MHPPGPGLSRRRLALFALVTTAALLSVVEAGARRVEAAGGPRPREAIGPCEFQQVDPHPDAPIVPGAPPGTRLINWTDLRQQTFQSPKPADVVRVVFVGGSALGGWGVPRYRQLTGVVRRLLDEATPGRRVEVINLGTTGWASAQFAWTLEALGPQMEPDLVVMLMGNNERMDVANGLALSRAGASLFFASRWLHRRSAFARLLRPVPSPPGFDNPAGPGPLSDGDAALPMPRLEELEAPRRVDRFVRQRLRRTVRRIAEATDAPALVSSVPVNHRYWRSRHEWHFLDDDIATDPEWGEAYWAWYHDAPERGVDVLRGRLARTPRDPGAHLVLGSFLDRAGDPTSARQHWRTAIEQSDLETGGLPARIVRAWATRELEGAPAAVALIQPWIGPAPSAEDPDGRGCHAAELRWFAGDVDGARPIFEACLLNGFLYRADPVINDALAQAAREAGATFFDLDEAVRGASEHGVPGFETFVDYCHYTPRGHLLVGHLLAAQAAILLGTPHAVPTWRSGLAEDRSVRAGRPSDRPELEHWAGASFDLARLQAPSPGPPPTAGPPTDESALGWTFYGNDQASRLSFAWAPPGEAAIDAYLHALEVDPEFEPARHNLTWLLGTEVGAWALRSAAQADALGERLGALGIDAP